MKTLEQLIEEAARSRMSEEGVGWTGEAGRNAVQDAMKHRLVRLAISLLSDEEVKSIAEQAHWDTQDHGD